jgi:hypothetical protein
MSDKPYSEAVSTAREIHAAQNIIATEDVAHPWMVKTTGGLWRIVTKKLSNRHKDSSFEIRLGEVPGATSVFGMSSIIPPEKVAYVMISGEANMCWQRFAIAKELMHIYTNFYADANMEGLVMIGDAIRSRSVLPLSSSHLLDAETFCLLTALELMIPWKLREPIVAAKRAERLSDYEIAKKLMIPEAMVSFFFSGDYESQSYKANRMLPAKS